MTKTNTFKFDITKEVNELKEAFTCRTCHNFFKQAVILNVCGHVQCYSCLETKSKTCSICKYPYNVSDITKDNLTESVIKTINNIENIFSQYTLHIRNKRKKKSISTSTSFMEAKNFPQDVTYQICVVQTPMKRNVKGETSLHLACKTGNFARIEKLIQSGVDINATDWAQWAPIHEAVEAKHYDCVELLLKHGALINVPGSYYITPLHKAISNNLDNITELLLKYGADKTSINYMGETPLDIETSKNKFKDIVPEMKYVAKVFFAKQIVVFSCNTNESKLQNLQNIGAKLVDLDVYMKTDEVTHAVVDDETLNFNLLLGIVKGIFVVSEKWIFEFPLTVFPYKHIVAKYRTVIRKSIQNKLERKPKLFDGISFYIVDYGDVAISNELNLDKTNLTMLIKAGGGNIMIQPHSPRTVSKDNFQPYHARNSNNLNACCNYIIFNESERPELLYTMRELQHKTSKWLINCILNFKIHD